MYRLFQVGVLVLSFVAVLFVSCTNEPVSPGAVSHPIAEASEAAMEHFAGRSLVILDDLGELHNQILEAFESIHPLREEERLSREEFMPIFVQATNDVMVAQGYMTACSNEDVTVLLECLDAYTESGIYDFYGLGESDPYDLLAYLYDKGEITEAEYRDYVAAFDELYRDGSPAPASTQDAMSEARRVASEIMMGSRRFWTSGDATGRSVSRGQFDGPRLVNWWDVACVAADAIGGIVTFRLVGPGHDDIVIAGAALASIAIMALAPDGAEAGGATPGGGGGSGGGDGGAG